MLQYALIGNIILLFIGDLIVQKFAKDNYSGNYSTLWQQVIVFKSLTEEFGEQKNEDNCSPANN